jgi:hypothetical protein
VLQDINALIVMELSIQSSAKEVITALSMIPLTLILKKRLVLQELTVIAFIYKVQINVLNVSQDTIAMEVSMQQVESVRQALSAQEDLHHPDQERMTTQCLQKQAKKMDYVLQVITVHLRVIIQFNVKLVITKT